MQYYWIEENVYFILIFKILLFRILHTKISKSLFCSFSDDICTIHNYILTSCLLVTWDIEPALHSLDIFGAAESHEFLHMET